MKPQLMIHFYHGRIDPEQDMEDWGLQGPTIGPFDAVIFTYLTDIRGYRDGEEVSIKRHEDMVVWEGVYYGDFEIFAAPPQAAHIDHVTQCNHEGRN